MITMMMMMMMMMVVMVMIIDNNHLAVSGGVQPLSIPLDDSSNAFMHAGMNSHLSGSHTRCSHMLAFCI